MIDNKGTVFWITGLSGAGKTTIGRCLHHFIKSRKDNVILLDGDELRVLFVNSDYSIEGRKKLALQYSSLCKMLSEQGIDVICCCIAMYGECRDWNRKNITNYKEIYLKVTLEELIKRDQKKLYSRALSGEIHNVMGVDLDFDEPNQSDIIIDNSGKLKPDEVIDLIIKECSI